MNQTIPTLMIDIAGTALDDKDCSLLASPHVASKKAYVKVTVV